MVVWDDDAGRIGTTSPEARRGGRAARDEARKETAHGLPARRRVMLSVVHQGQPRGHDCETAALPASPAGLCRVRRHPQARAGRPGRPRERGRETTLFMILLVHFTFQIPRLPSRRIG